MPVHHFVPILVEQHSVTKQHGTLEHGTTAFRHAKNAMTEKKAEVRMSERVSELSNDGGKKKNPMKIVPLYVPLEFISSSELEEEGG